MKKKKVYVIVEQGCVTTVYAANIKLDIEVVDLDGDYRDEGKLLIEKLEANKEIHQVWP